MEDVKVEAADLVRSENCWCGGPSILGITADDAKKRTFLQFGTAQLTTSCSVTTQWKMSQSEVASNHASLPLQRAAGLILVLDTPKGRGVFASSCIAAGTVVDISPVLVFPYQEVDEHTNRTVLQHYTYTWPSPDAHSPPTQAIALGLGSLFNHSTLHQNVGWRRAVPDQCLIYTALRDIAEGEELCISYGGPGVLWFEDADAEEVKEADRRELAAQESGKDQGDLGASGLLYIQVDAD